MTEAQQPTRTFVPANAPKPYVKGSFGGFNKAPIDRENKEERTLKQRAINRQSARRDAIDFLTAQGKPFTLEQVFVVAENLFDWVNK